MKTLLLSLKLMAVLVLISGSICAQTYISPRLNEQLNASGDKFFKVNLILQEQYNLDSLVNVFRMENYTAQERALSTLSELQQFADKTQKNILNQLAGLSATSVRNVQSFWAVNLICIDAKPAAIKVLASNVHIAKITANEHNYRLIEPIQAPGKSAQTGDMAETGIYAIHAPELWAMGYTGKNRIVLGVDTGVKSQHTALSDRFLGNYRPLTESWFGYNNSSPEDISFSSYHGTHTLGTVLGLDKMNKDTIGIAYNAYWMAADPIVSNISDVRTLDEIVACFEWAMNPDGDINTYHDMPDVITNSWGWDGFYDNSDCNIPEVQLLNAVAAAGIGVVFSAGNNGPDMSTIGQPANIATNELNVFSVGAIDGNSNDFRIAGFSSRGPTTCINQDDGFSRWVKPEVVAPGVNVRSAQNIGEYGPLSGTSMAAPHVAGAFLLLKEAFPYLPGEDILAALYHSADDLGEPGEDNTYGKGIINTKAAFDYLAQNNNPSPPVSNDYDIAMGAIENIPTFFTFDAKINPEVMIFNQGSSTVQGVNVSVKVNDEPAVSEVNMQTLSPGEKTKVSFSNIPLFEGKNYLTFSSDLTIDYPEASLINNTKHVIIHVPKKTALPYTEDFESTDFYLSNSELTLINYDKDWTWTIDTAGGLPLSEQSLRIDFTKMKSRNRQHDEVITPLLVIPETEKEINLRFRHAYAARVASLFKDSLIIMASTDEGLTWSDTLWARGDEKLATIDKNMGNARFVPQSEEEWATTYINLNQYKGKNLLISFKTTNDNGSNLYLDDIMVYEGQWPDAIIEKGSALPISLELFPNPATSQLSIVVKNNLKKGGKISVINTLGTCLIQDDVNNEDVMILNVSSLPKGVYFVQYTQPNQKVTTRFIKM